MRHDFRLFALGWISILLLAGTVRTYAADIPGIRQFETAQNLKLQMPAPQLAFGKPSDTTTTRLSFEAYGRTFDVDLRPNHRLVASLLASGQLQYDDLDIYAGVLPSVPGSWARFSLGGGNIRGAVWDGNDLYLVEPAARIRPLLSATVDNKATVIVKASDLSFTINEPALGVAANVSAGAIAADKLLAHVATMPLPTRRISVGLILERGQHEGPVTEEFMLVLLQDMNLADGIFTSQVNMHLSIDQLESFDQQSTPFSGNDIVELLTQLVNYKSSRPEFAQLGLVHLMTRRVLSDNTIGIAQLASACTPSDGASITQVLYALSWLVTAHEIAHNFGAAHDGEPGACAATPKTFIMAAEYNGSDEFSACSLSTMNDYLSQATCLTPLSTGDLEIAVEPVPFSLYHKEELRFQYFVNNVGVESVFDGVTRLQPDAGFELVGMFPGGYGPVCNPVPTNPVCELGNVYDGQSLPFTVVLTPVTVGPGSITLSAIGLNDSNAANNSHTLDFDIQAATRIFSLGVVSPSVGQHMTARSTVRVWNLGDFASAASLRMYTDPLHVLSTPAAGCTSFNSYTLDCDIPTLAPGAELLLPLDQLIGDMQLEPDDQVSVVTWLETATELHGSTPLERVIHVVSVFGSYRDLWGEFVKLPADVVVGESTDFTVALVNDGPDAAVDVDLAVAVSANVQTSIGTAPAGACSKQDIRVVCRFDEIQRGERIEIGIESTGLVAGFYDITLTVDTLIGRDPDSSNNSATVRHRVNAKPGAAAPQGGGGGGALSTWLLFALAVTVLWPGRRRMAQSFV